MIRAQSSGFSASKRTNRAFHPRSLMLAATAFPDSSFRAATKTVAPFSASISAQARPIPLVEAVTTATLQARLYMVIPLYVGV